MTLPALRRQVAIHEAAHVCAAASFGWTVGEVSIEADEGTKGRARLEPRSRDGLTTAFEAATVSLVAHLAVAEFGAADPAAYGMQPLRVTPEETVEAFESGDTLTALGWYGENIGTDQTRAEQIAEKFAQSEGESVHLLGLAYERARTLLADPRFRERVERLAALLLRHGTVSGATALAEIHNDDREATK